MWLIFCWISIDKSNSNIWDSHMAFFWDRVNRSLSLSPLKTRFPFPLLASIISSLARLGITKNYLRSYNSLSKRIIDATFRQAWWALAPPWDSLNGIFQFQIMIFFERVMMICRLAIVLIKSISCISTQGFLDFIFISHNFKPLEQEINMSFLGFFWGYSTFIQLPSKQPYVG